jgi:hypothetical protein
VGASMEASEEIGESPHTRIARAIAAYVRGGSWALPSVRALLKALVRVHNAGPLETRRSRCFVCGVKFEADQWQRWLCAAHRGHTDSEPHAPKPEPASIVESAALITEGYCADCNRHYPKKDLVDGDACPKHKRPVEKFLAVEHHVGGWIDRRRGEDDAAYWARLAALRVEVDSALYAEMFEEQAKVAASIRSDTWESYGAVERALLGIVPLWNAMRAPIRRCLRCGGKYAATSRQARQKVFCKRCAVAERVERHRKVTPPKPRTKNGWYRDHVAGCAACSSGAGCAEYIARIDDEIPPEPPRRGHGQVSLMDHDGKDDAGPRWALDARATTRSVLDELVANHGYRRDVRDVFLATIRRPPRGTRKTPARIVEDEDNREYQTARVGKYQSTRGGGESRAPKDLYRWALHTAVSKAFFRRETTEKVPSAPLDEMAERDESDD